MKFSAETARRTAAASLAAAALLGSTGCSFANYQATTHDYAASDGTRAEFADMKFRHMAFVTEGEGSPARLIGTLSNTGLEDAEVEIASDSETIMVTVPARETLSLEHDEEIIIDSFQGTPGSLHEVTVSVNGEAEEIDASVFDGVLPEYRDLVPGGYDETVTDHLEHGPDTYGSGTSHHDPEEAGH
ncbi:hypothetical protein [Nesterenkonia lutea]|uniref:DNA modification methylase n=1 Tax=Nesterenkonia lutea TaxID=272919 RepID=A0ABR9JHQ7_9MICC|nr:hypothetical protein [Nesterenkonia lutea]MBE1525471.1 hypothetical protein [Nesterenkonia lutea]